MRLAEQPATTTPSLPILRIPLAARDEVGGLLEAAGGDAEALRLGRRVPPALRGLGAALRRRLEESGVALLRAGPVEAELGRALFCASGRLLGEPICTYGTLYEVADKGGSHLQEKIPISMTGAVTGMHTDSSARDTVPEWLGLLCEEPATAGGDSQIADIARIRERLAQRRPDVLQILQRPFLRDIVTPGASRRREDLERNRFPVLELGTDDFTFRYMRYWIETAHQQLEQPLLPEEQEAFDVLDQELSNPVNLVQVRMQKGDMLWANNRHKAHGRTPYVGRQRRLWRMWIGD